MLRSTGGGSLDGVLSIVTATRNGRARAARVLELAGEHVQAVGQRARREGQRRARDAVGTGAASAVELRAGRGDRLARRQHDLVGRSGDGAVGGGRRDQHRERCCRSARWRARTGRRGCRASRSRSRAGRRGRRRRCSCRMTCRTARSCRSRSRSRCRHRRARLRRRRGRRRRPSSRSERRVPETTAPGSVSVTLGPVESTVTEITAVVRTLPAASVISARMSVGAVRRARRVPCARRTARSCRSRRR